MCVDHPRSGRRLTGQPEQVVTLEVGETQRPRKRGEHQGRGTGGAALFQPRQVIHRQAGELGDLLAAQTRDATVSVRGQTDVGGADALAPGAQAAGQLATDGRCHDAHDRAPPCPLGWPCES
jgi:hypothetical protein